MADIDVDALLAVCADEPIHVPEAVQPFGAVLLVDDDGVVRVRSDDPAGLLGESAPLGAPLAGALGSALGARRLRDGSVLEVMGPDGCPLDVVAHTTGAGLLLEVEEAGPERLPADELITRQRPLWEARTLEQLLEAVVVEVRALLGFDRVMAYRFDAEWNGEVVAESLAPGLRPYRGLRYPASDIPAQARALYRRNRARLIADVAYRPSVLVHEDPGRTAPLDLSDVGLRSVSPVHLRYLANMGVAASMSLSLLVDGELWGLVACHHESGPRRPDPSRRRAAAAVAELASSLIVSVTEAEGLTDRVLATGRVTVLRAALESSDDPLLGLAGAPDLLDLVGAVGAVVSLDGRVARVGDAPAAAAARIDVAELLAARPSSAADPRPAASDALTRPHQHLVGVLATSLGAPDSWIVWYRPELVQEIRWAGDPRSDEVEESADGRLRLGPRRSFATFVESVRGRCRPWRTAERWAAGELGDQLGAALARRTRQRLHAAQVVQRALLLDGVVAAAGFDVAVRYLPAHGDPLGGDWHDVFTMPDGSAAVVVGDTVGHGLEVAGIMAQLRNALRAYLVASGDPAESLVRVDALVGQLLPGELATVVACVVDPASGRYRLATAGHLPPVLVGTVGASLLEAPRAPVLGLSVERNGVSLEGVLDEGEALLLFSDGLVERRDRDLPSALDALRRALVADPAGASPEVADAAVLCDRALAAGTRSDDDDVTVLALRRPRTGRD